MFDPLSSEARSPWLAGLTEACYKISTILDLDTAEITDFPLIPVDNRRLIYQAPLGNKLWMDFPAPVIRKNGIVITPEKDNFTINFLGGSVEFEQGFAPTESDTITANATYIVDNSNTINDILEQISGISDSATKFKGYFSTFSALQSTLPTGVGGDWAIVGGTENVIYIWNSTLDQWKPSSSEVDLSDYYQKEEVNNLLDEKEDFIYPHGETSTDDGYYYGGQKSWVKLSDMVQNVPLTGLDTTDDSKVDTEDTVQEAIGKLQAQIDNAGHDLSGTATPTTSTEGEIGQDYINTATGEKYHLVEITTDGEYIWKKYQNELDFDTTPTSGSNNPVTSDGIYTALESKASISDLESAVDNINSTTDSLQSQIDSKPSTSEVTSLISGKADKVIPSSTGNIAILSADGNLVDSGKGVDDVGRSPIPVTVALPASQWLGYDKPFTQTVSVFGVISNETQQIITVAPYPDMDNIQAITNAYIYCTAQGQNSLTFVALKNKPTTQVTFNVSIQNL